MHENAERFQHLLATDKGLQDRLQRAAMAYDGNPQNDREVFDAVVAPIASSLGLALTFDDMRSAALDGRELTEDELDMLAGGAGGLYRRLVSGALVATMVFASIPARAFAQGTSGANDGAAITQLDASGMRALDTVSYMADFSATDVATPEGVMATDDGLRVDPGAKVSLVAAAEDAGGFEMDWDTGEKTIEYTRKALEFVDEDVAKVADYGKALFGLIKAGVSLDFGDVFDNGVDLLKMMGVIGEEEKAADVSNEQILDEVKGLRDLLSGMSTRLDEATKQAYRNRLVGFDNVIGSLAIDCEVAENMFKAADKIATERGLKTMSDTVELPEAPTFPDYPQENPAEPVLELPAEPVLELPAEPVLELNPEPRHPSEFSADGRWERLGETWDDMVDEWHRLYGVDYMNYTIDYQLRSTQWRQAHSAWEAECEQLRAEYDQAHAEWEAACEQPRAEWEQAHAEWEKYDYNAAVAAWQAECERLAADYDATCQTIKAEHAQSYGEFSQNYTRELVKIMKECQSAGMEEFEDFDALMRRIDTNFTTLAIECAKAPGSSPFTAFDSFWNMHFNWETQGYYLRQAYRANAEFALKRSYTLLAAYYNLIGNPNGPRKALTTAMQNGLNGIEKIPAGLSPEDVIAYAKSHSGRELNIMCYAVGQKVKFVSAECVYKGWYGWSEKQADDILDEYRRRLNGRSVKEDLELAGINEADTIGNGRGSYSRATKPSEAEGIAFRVKEKSDTYTARMLMWDGSVKDVLTYHFNGGGQLHGYLMFIGY